MATREFCSNLGPVYGIQYARLPRGRNFALAAVPLHPQLVSTPVIIDGWLPEQPVVLGRH
jgi:hypothetical protein